jgi:acyl-CoA hydrolase
VSAAEAAALVRPGMWLDYGTSHAQPDAFDAALAARRGDLHDVNIRTCLSLRPRAVLEQDPDGLHFNLFCTHFSAYDRRWADRGRVFPIPVNLGEIADYYRRFMHRPDIVILQTRPMDDAGNFNLGTTAVWLRAIVEQAKCVIVETNPAYPHTLGIGHEIHVSEVDYVIEGAVNPPGELFNPKACEIDRAVAHNIAPEIADGACLQIGVGGMPNAVCAALLDIGVKDLGVHTEMLVDGIVDLYKAGRITGRHKTLDPGKITYAFAAGSRYLYEAIDRNPDFHIAPAEYTNMPHNVMRNHNVVAINNTTQMDLQGQAASESDGHRHISGTGGQLQFVRGAYAAPGGKSFICLSSTYERHGLRKSRIVAELTPGNIVTTPRSDMMYVVTEYGIANLKGKSVCERARALIGLAHPDFREDLERQARNNRLLPKEVRKAGAPPLDPAGQGPDPILK